MDDTFIDNDGLHYIPKPHKWSLLNKPLLAGDVEGLMPFLTEEQKAEFKPIPIELKKGYATFHHPITIHGIYEKWICYK
ncbi:hypothetical protein GCM10007962_30720 [Yeosuana aromativorans]|uniref:Uncharacterized protein n=1 Tax=Yeosuana aromativorans TaxID=288019 RepID=A0A8J3FIL9_9FLAO|nr:phytanoyl-CoA dioxygenase family protein [Yeosuana aromativorans]GGK34140.1 hypothetical protein GCM10007962_30720 [Yeosuana aromativorans]